MTFLSGLCSSCSAASFSCRTPGIGDNVCCKRLPKPPVYTAFQPLGSLVPPGFSQAYRLSSGWLSIESEEFQFQAYWPPAKHRPAFETHRMKSQGSHHSDAKLLYITTWNTVPLSPPPKIALMPKHLKFQIIKNCIPWKMGRAILQTTFS